MRRSHGISSGLDSKMFSELAERDEEVVEDQLFHDKIEAKWDTSRPRPEQFAGTISTDTIDKDTKWVERTKRGFAENIDAITERQTKLGRKLEYCMMEGCYYHNWVGPDCSVMPGSELDDFRHGTDMVLVFNQAEGKPLLLAVDVVCTSETDQVNQKIIRDITNIEAGTLNNVRYFKPEDNPEMCGPIKMPHVVLGVKTEKGRQLYQKFVDTLNGNSPKYELAESPVAKDLQEELQFQLGYYIELSTRKLWQFKLGKKGGKLPKEDRSMLETLKDLSEGVKKINNLSDEINTDNFRELLNFLEVNEVDLRRLEPTLADNAYQHFNLYKYLESIKKDSHTDAGVTTDGEEDPVRDALSIPNKEMLESGSSARTWH
ncbi:MAG: hypothetical protein ABIB97_03960 [Patescibacteria group bacterium]